jgi:hypothetical protein
MPSTIVSTPQFASGGLILSRHNASVADDGLVQVQMHFACRGTPQIVASNMRRFIPDAPPPMPLPSTVSALRLQTGTVYLTEAHPHISNGICYIDAKYVGSSADQAPRITEAWTARTFNGEILGRRLANNGNLLAVVFGTVSFDYTAVARSVRWTVVGDVVTQRGALQGDIPLGSNLVPVDLRNLRIVQLDLNAVQLGTGYMDDEVFSVSTEKIGRVTRITKTVVGEYVSDNDGLLLLPRRRTTPLA